MRTTLSATVIAIGLGAGLVSPAWATSAPFDCSAAWGVELDRDRMLKTVTARLGDEDDCSAPLEIGLDTDTAANTLPGGGPSPGFDLLGVMAETDAPGAAVHAAAVSP